MGRSERYSLEMAPLRLSTLSLLFLVLFQATLAVTSNSKSKNKFSGSTFLAAGSPEYTDSYDTTYGEAYADEPSYGLEDDTTFDEYRFKSPVVRRRRRNLMETETSANSQSNSQSHSQSQSGAGIDPSALTGGSSSQGFMGYPLSTWLLIGLVVSVIAILCVVGIFFFRKHLAAVISCVENSIWYTIKYMCILPVQYLVRGLRWASYPIKEGCVDCCNSVNNYYKPYKITS